MHPNEEQRQKKKPADKGGSFWLTRGPSDVGGGEDRRRHLLPAAQGNKRSLDHHRRHHYRFLLLPKTPRESCNGRKIERWRGGLTRRRASDGHRFWEWCSALDTWTGWSETSKTHYLKKYQALKNCRNLFIQLQSRIINERLLEKIMIGLATITEIGMVWQRLEILSPCRVMFDGSPPHRWVASERWLWLLSMPKDAWIPPSHSTNNFPKKKCKKIMQTCLEDSR